MISTERPSYCGRCAQYRANPEHHRTEWEGACAALNIGRNEDSEPCDNPRLYRKM